MKSERTGSGHIEHNTLLVLRDNKSVYCTVREVFASKAGLRLLKRGATFINFILNLIDFIGRRGGDPPPYFQFLSEFDQFDRRGGGEASPPIFSFYPNMNIPIPGRGGGGGGEYHI
jgi:hypothetical protein